MAYLVLKLWKNCLSRALSKADRLMKYQTLALFGLVPFIWSDSIQRFHTRKNFKFYMEKETRRIICHQQHTAAVSVVFSPLSHSNKSLLFCLKYILAKKGSVNFYYTKKLKIKTRNSIWQEWKQNKTKERNKCKVLVLDEKIGWENAYF